MKGEILFFASEQASKLTLKDWGATRGGLYVTEKNGDIRYCDEAQDVFNDYYLDILEGLENLIIPFVKKSYILGGKAYNQMVFSHLNDNDYCVDTFIKENIRD